MAGMAGESLNAGKLSKEDTVSKTSGTTTLIELPPLRLEQLKLKLVGDSPLVTHAWSAKARRLIRDKQQKRAKQAKEAKNPIADFLDALYWLTPRPDPLDTGDQDAVLEVLRAAVFGFPAIGLKAAAVDACSSVDGITKVEARSAFHIDGEMVTIESDTPPEPIESMVKIAMGTTDLRYRPMFRDWAITFALTYNANVLSPEQIVNLFNVAGFGVGIGEHRPQRDGSWGRFHVGGTD